MHRSVRESWLAFNEPLAGRTDFMYLDVDGFVTTGLESRIDTTREAMAAPSDAERGASHALARDLAWHRPVDDAPAAGDEVDAEWDLVKSRLDLAPLGRRPFQSLTTLRVRSEESDRRAFAELDDLEKQLRLRAEFADFDAWPADAQLGLLSMAWIAGPQFKLPAFQARAGAADWIGAAGECRLLPEHGTARRRNDLDRQLFEGAARVVAEGLDVEQLLFGMSEPG